MPSKQHLILYVMKQKKRTANEYVQFLQDRLRNKRTLKVGLMDGKLAIASNAPSDKPFLDFISSDEFFLTAQCLGLGDSLKMAVRCIRKKNDFAVVKLSAKEKDVLKGWPITLGRKKSTVPR